MHLKIHFICLVNLQLLHFIMTLLYVFCFRFIMPLIEEIAPDSYSSLEENGESSVTVPRSAERLEIQSESVNLCFIQKHGIVTEDEGFILDTSESSRSSGDLHIFSRRSSIKHQSHMPVIEEIDSHDVADSMCTSESLSCDNVYNAPETDLHVSSSVNVDGLVKEEDDPRNSKFQLLCKSVAFTAQYRAGLRSGQSRDLAQGPAGPSTLRGPGEGPSPPHHPVPD